MIDFEYKEQYGVYDLKKLITLLRSENGCPWDRVQTHESIRRNLIEEAYEAAEAIDEGDVPHLREELGDVLTQVVFHADIENDAGSFDLDDVADAVCRKMISRHPAIFGDGSDMRSGADLDSWEALKREEKQQETVTSTLEAVARSLPALWRAEKIQAKAEKNGMEAPGFSDLLVEMRDCMDDMQICAGSGEDASTAIGDMLFFVVACARLLGIDPELALTARMDGFIETFRQMEIAALERGCQLKDIPQEERDAMFSKVIDAQ